jgi:H+-translocating NAD(P) transhydrogenase subunit alpha
MLRVLVAKETTDGETRVAAVPETVKAMVKAGLSVAVEPGAGEQAFISDKAFADAGAQIADDAQSGWSSADVVLKVREPHDRPDLGSEVGALKEGATIIGFLNPYKADESIRSYVARKISSLPMELVPRITRAQKMDALSSQANIAGYKAVLLAAAHLPKYFPLLMTAAGTVKPARVVIMGAGVAGLQAIATAKRLGAIVEASDIRPETKEQVESLGGKFIPLPDMGESGSGAGGYAREVTKEFLQKQQEIVGEHVAMADVVITTALVPGRPAPKLVPAWMVERMKDGSIVVDLAVEQGGNCELSEAGKDVRKHGVLIMGPPNLAATLPADASMLYARNVLALLQDHLTKEGTLKWDMENEVTRGTLLTHEGKIVHGPTAERLGG